MMPLLAPFLVSRREPPPTGGLTARRPVRCNAVRGQSAYPHQTTLRSDLIKNRTCSPASDDAKTGFARVYRDCIARV